MGWNSDEIVKGIMGDMLIQARRQLPTIRCPEHQETYSVNWSLKGTNVEGAVDDPCCEELEQELNRRFQQLRLS
jgi:hypothetical protein